MLNTSFWNQIKGNNHYPPLKENISCDLCIVGAGLTGISLAYFLQSSGLDIVLVDQQEFASGASSMNTGKLTAQHGDIYHQLAEKKGLECAKRYYEINKKAIEQIVQWKKEGFPFALTSCPTTLITRKKENQQRLQKEASIYQALQIPHTTTKQEIPVSSYYSLTMLQQYQVHPKELMLSLINRINQIRCYEHTRIQEVKYQAPLSLITEQGFIIETKKVVFCTQAPIVDQYHFFFTRYSCIRSYLLLKPYPWKKTFSLISIDEVPLSIRTIKHQEQKYLLICDEEHKCGQNKENRYQKLDFRTQVFSDQILYQWSNQDYNTFDQLPFIGTIHQNTYVSFGYNMWGNSWSVAASLLLTDAILHQNHQPMEDYRPNRLQDIFTLSYITENCNVILQWLLSYRFSKQELHNGSYLAIQGKRYGYYRDEKQVYLVDVKCPHMGCILQYNPFEHTWDCPCHASRFTYQGGLINGPSTTCLKQNPQQNRIVLPIKK
ncbi:MAG: FAD-dependent oxidoreductase [Erysipelotrichaceae bacterium]|nr:FAD-dependent oxidoreductase [Erysipelotrichaceae bacterium]